MAAAGRPRVNKKAETSLSKQARDELASRGYWCIRVQSGIIPAMYGARQRFIHFAEPGTPDTFVMRRDGVSGWLEFKKPGETLSEVQIAWHARARRCGFHVGVAESISQAVTFVRDLPTPCAKVL